MSVKTRNFTLLSAALAALFLLAMTLTTCDSPLGFGDPIDWESPVLTLDSETNPRYVRLGTKLSGKVTDNIGVERVVLRDSISGETQFIAVLTGSDSKNKSWEIEMDFTAVELIVNGEKLKGEELNGKKVTVEVVASDKAGNSSGTAIRAITLIIDFRKPFTKDIIIERTPMRTSLPEPIEDLIALEESDPEGEISANTKTNRYQNGWFRVKAKLDEEETRIENNEDTKVTLNIYHVDVIDGLAQEIDLDSPLLSLPMEVIEGSNTFSPTWLLKEEDIIAAGNAQWPGYADRYYGKGGNPERYYYLLEIVAQDRSGNELRDKMDYFCLWYDSDFPRGLLDSNIRGTGEEVIISRGASLPVEFFDDDSLDWAYTEMLTREQWNGTKPVNDANLTIPQSGGDDGKLTWLMAELRKGTVIYNWKLDKRNGEVKEQITNLLNLADDKSLDEYVKYVPTGDKDSDYGAFVLVSFAGDKKLSPPHDGNAAERDKLKKSRGRVWPVQVIDENAPLIVFDTVDTTADGYDPVKHPGNDTIPEAKTGNSPEENTFPKLTDGKTFIINGYTLRENGNGNNSVTKFRLAWIPYNIDPSGPDAYIKAVQDALYSYGTAQAIPFPDGVQYWDLQASMVEGTAQEVGAEKIPFRKQVFRKTFDVLGGQDDINPDYKNFTYKNELENETKLFIFYAEDNMGHEVFRQLRLLGNKTPPEITVYDLTSRGVAITEGPPSGLPDLNNTNSANGNDYYFYNNTGLIDTAGRTRYETTRFKYQPTGFDLLKTSITSNSLSSGEEASTSAAYPRETIIKYWVKAESNGDLSVEKIVMRDITFTNNDNQVGHYDNELSLSYVEKVSEITQRVFLFEATDSLKNVARIQRTVAVTNAAVLNSITTSTQTGSYGIGTTITLQANFTNLVKWEGTNPPLLNVRYNYHGTSQLKQIATKTAANTASLSLDFDLVVDENDTGVVETIYLDIPNSNGHTAAGNETAKTNRPITIPTGTSILDFTRGDAAFTPGYSDGFVWTSGKGSLQASKTITLQGVRPVRNNFTLTSIPSGKTRYTDTYPGLYYKADETIEFTLAANVPIFTGAFAPVIQFQVNGTSYNAPWARTGNTSSQMVFSVLVNSANIANNGAITAISLNNASSIVDSVGNAFTAGTAAINLSTDGQVRIENYSGYTGNVRVTIDKVVPTAPPTTLNTTSVGSTPTTTINYNASPNLAITNFTATNFIPSGETAPVDTQYSLNNGVTWVTFPTAVNTTAQPWTTANNPPNNTLNIRPGQWTLVTRYTDRAGNEGATTTQSLEVHDAFPKLIAVTPVQANGWHRTGTLQFDLNFEDQVQITTGNTITITLKNRSTASNTQTTGAAVATATSTTAPGTLVSTIRVSFQVDATNNLKEMRDGLYVSAVNFANLRDRFGNTGGTWAPSPSTWSGAAGTGTAPTINPNTSTCTNLSAGLRVDAIAPTVSSRSPTQDAVSSYPGNATDKRNVITLTFNEPVMKGNGVITIQPKTDDFLVPPVFDDTGYYLDCVDETVATASSNRTIWIPGFYDIYNSLPSTAAGNGHKNALTQSTTETSQRNPASAGTIPSSVLDGDTPSMTRLLLDTRTGQPVGPYVKTTHGLKAGYGYSGNYSGTHGGNEVFGPNTEDGYTNNFTLFSAMVPDTSTKWVLRYNLSINNSDTAITGIRDALKAAKFRWQEIEVGWDNVTIGTPNATTGATEVSIRLSEPLLQGLQWTLSYPAGTFTDQAGNPAAVQTANAYTFWSQGVRKPVIRVDRKSYDARDTNHHAPKTGAANDSSSFTYAAPTDATWGIDAFNNVAYRIETETPGATITYGVTGRRNSITGAGTTGAYNAVTVNAGTDTVTADINTPANSATNRNGIAGTIWSGNITAATGTGYTATTWQAESANRNSFWVKPNLLRKFGRSGNYDARSAQIVNGDQRRSSGWLSVLHSYNADATAAILNAAFNATNFSDAYAANATSPVNGTVNFGALEAGKSYVVATATRSGTTSNRGYEGVFRTLIVLNGQKGNRSYTENATSSGTNPNPIQNDAAGINKILVGGSNVKSGTPSIPGFPLLDGAETGDARFVKMMYNVDNSSNTSNTGKRFYWVSTEIVCEFYMAYFGNGGNVQRTGDVNNYVMVNYGDLTYAFKLDRFPD